MKSQPEVYDNIPNEGWNALRRKLDEISQRFDRIEQVITSIETRLSTLEQS